MVSTNWHDNLSLRGVLLHDEPLAHYTSLGIGGPAKHLYKPADLADVQAFLKILPPDESLLWLGLGSNTLIRDGGVNGTVIISLASLKVLEPKGDGQVRAEAGVACAKMARYCARQGMSGAAFWAGIPGTMGGALRMNAGCHHHETWEFVVDIETIDRQGNIDHHTPDEYNIAYRSVKGHDDKFFVAATFAFGQGSKEEELEEIRTLLKRRSDTQPTGDLNCGSVFRNPEGDFAARLIESCGLKGHQIGGAQVSTKHANFIINKNNASALDIENLINHVHTEVKTKHNISLIREVHIIGETSK